MIDIRPILQIAGILLSMLAVAMFLPMTADLVEGHDDWLVFLGAGSLTLFVGMALFLTNLTSASGLSVRQAFLLTGVSWIVLCAFAALPFAFADLGLDYTDALFEATAGLTTTGATVVTDLQSRQTGILLWRALLQWLGGIGIIVTAVAVLPMLRIAGMQLFSTESSEQEKMLPRTVRIAAVITIIYAVFSVLCFLAYWGAGMSTFDALAHAMTTVSTAGFSTHDGSIGHFDNQSIELVAMVFMILGALPFVIYMQMTRGHFVPLWRDVQLRLFMSIIVVVVALLTIYRSIQTSDVMFSWSVLREVSFNVVAIATSTGYSTEDFGAWGGFAVAIFFILLFLGGCTGSTAGGIKMFRVHVLAAMLYIQLRRLIQPHGVFIAHYNDMRISDAVAQSVATFLIIFVAGFFLLTAGLAAHDLDFVTSASGAVAALANIGPGLGPVIGPQGNYSELPDTAKLLLCIGMLLGRLEFLTLLVLVTPDFWRE